tara:strand:- start:364 stop:987 length:624 start_codon:yes stop_codon:yes gene_type:complete
MCINNNAAIATADTEAERIRLEEEQRQTRIRTGREAINSAFDSYDDGFYADRANSYIDFATPDLEDQFKNATKDLANSLARRGVSQSSEAINRKAEQLALFNKAKTSIIDKGRANADAVRNALGAAKGDLLTQNQALADPTLMANTAATRIANATTLPAYSPIGQIFASGTDAIATGVGLNARGQLNDAYNLGNLFSSPSAARIIRS